jgi:uncharacterized protein
VLLASRRKLRLVGLGLLLVFAAVVLERAGRIFWIERSALKPQRGSLDLPIDSAGVPGIRAVRFPTFTGDSLAGWYVPPRHGATVILLHGTGADRSSMLPELRLLARAGIGVLAYDSPGHGLSDGVVEWGEAERNAVSQAATWVLQQPGVDATKLGAAGFSYGGYILCEAAAWDQRLRRVALLATPTDGEDVAYHAYRRWSPAAGWFALQVDRLLGFEPDTTSAAARVSRIAPRPLLLVAGDRDDVVPLPMMRALYDRARSPKALLVVHTAGHGRYLEAEPERYARTLVAFFGADAAAQAVAGTPQ